MSDSRYRCLHGHIINETIGGCSPVFLNYWDPKDIAYCAMCEHKQTELVPVGPNRAETRQYCKAERIREAQDEC